MSIEKNLVVLSTNESINTTTGGMVVHGGLAIRKNLNVMAINLCNGQHQHSISVTMNEI